MGLEESVKQREDYNILAWSHQSDCSGPLTSMPASSPVDVSESVPLGLQIPTTWQHSHKIEEKVHLRALQMRASHL
jgi:hypothetical protein